jgi:MSHA biogenesis protein MshJ
LKKTIHTIESKYAALNTRERWMVFCAGLAVLYGLLNTVLLSPVLNKQKILQSELAQTQQQTNEIQQQIATLAQTPLVDVDALNKSKLEKLNASIQQQKQQLATLNDTLVSPAHMPDLLKNLMQNYQGIRMVGMKTIPPEDFLEKPIKVDPITGSASNVDPDLPVIFRHGLELTLSGNYMELMRYAEALQALSHQVLWDKAVLNTKEYPVSELTITVYTLSLDKTWLSI